MAMISYAQNAEDVLLNRVFAGETDGFYIDVGAAHPLCNSVTRHFYGRGWRGINIEPTAALFELLRNDRGRDINLKLGLSSRDGTMTLCEIPSVPTWSTLSMARVKTLRESGLSLIERTIPVTTLAQICEQYVWGPIDFLKVDVEGHEREVLAGGDWRRWRPRVVVIEATEPETMVPNHHRWEDLLLEAEYLFAAFDGLNRFYVRAEDRDLLPALSLPVNVMDDYLPYRFVEQLEATRGHIEMIRGELEAALGELEATRGRPARTGTVGPMVIIVGVRVQWIRRRWPRLAAMLQRGMRLYRSIPSRRRGGPG